MGAAHARGRLTGLLLAACTPTPTTVAGCAELGSPGEIEECRYRLVAPLVDEPAAFEAALGQIESPESRDLLLLRLAIPHPNRAARLCQLTSTAGAKEKCKQVLGRPHLQSTPRPPREPE